MIIEVILISVIIALIRRGKIDHITKYEVKLKSLFFAYLIVQLALVFFGNKLTETIGNYTMFVYLLSYLLLFGFLLRNIERPEMMIILAGVFLNFTVTFINGGKMPLSLDAAAMAGLAENGNVFLQKMSAISMVMGTSTKLKILCDIIPMPSFYPLSVVISVGDLILFVGLFLAIQKMLVRETMKENLFSAKKEREREEEFFNKDVKLVDISEFFEPEENANHLFETGSEHETNAITRLIEEISEVKEPAPGDNVHIAHEEAPHHNIPKEKQQEQARDNQEFRDKQVIDPGVETAATNQPHQLKPEEEQEQHEKTSTDSAVQAPLVSAKSAEVVIEVAEEMGAVVHEPEKMESTEASIAVTPGEGVEVEPGQLTFLDEEMAKYIDMFEINSPLKDYIKNIAQQTDADGLQKEQEHAKSDADPSSLAADGTEDIMRQYLSPDTAASVSEAQIVDTEISEALTSIEAMDDEEETAESSLLSDTRQLSMRDLARVEEEDRVKLEEETIGQPVITRQIARPSTRTILRAIKGGAGFEYNEDKYTLTIKDDEEVPLQERKEMFLQQLYEYDIDIRKTNAVNNKEKEKIETDIKREQGINVDDMFIIQNGRFIENPNYKFRRKR